MDNLRVTRRRGHVRGTLTREELEEFIEIDFSDYAEAVKQLDACHAFGRPADAKRLGKNIALKDHLSY